MPARCSRHHRLPVLRHLPPRRRRRRPHLGLHEPWRGPAPLTGIDPPTLLGVYASASYFHDGSAATLADVFRVSGGQTLPAEAGTHVGGAQRVNNFVDINNDDTVRGRAYVQLEAAGQLLRYSNVQGGPGGTGAVELRYSNSRTSAQTQTLSLRVNGNLLPAIQLPATDNDPTWRSTHWNSFRIEGVPLNPGTSNTLEFGTDNWYLAIDEVLVAHAGHLAQAQPHRRVSTLPPAERDALLAFLRELDGSKALAPLPEGVFANGFEP